MTKRAIGHILGRWSARGTVASRSGRVATRIAMWMVVQKSNEGNHRGVRQLLERSDTFQRILERALGDALIDSSRKLLKDISGDPLSRAAFAHRSTFFRASVRRFRPNHPRLSFRVLRLLFSLRPRLSQAVHDVCLPDPLLS